MKELARAEPAALQLMRPRPITSVSLPWETLRAAAGSAGIAVLCGQAGVRPKSWTSLLPQDGLVMSYAQHDSGRTSGADIPEGVGPEEFMRRARALDAKCHPCLAAPALHATLSFAAQAALTNSAGIEAWRRRVLDELWELREEFAEEQRQWFEKLAPSVQRFYVHPDKCRQIPLMRHLARLIGYPFESLESGLTHGFNTIGAIPTDHHWTPRREPTVPEVTVEELAAHAKTHLSELVRKKPCRNWAVLKSKLQEEVASHRTVGPLEAPPDMPPEDVAFLVAFHFDVEQKEPDGTCKIRGCDDWLRGKQNASTSFKDKLRTQGLDDIAALARFVIESRGGDHAAAVTAARLETWMREAEERCARDPPLPVRAGVRVSCPSSSQKVFGSEQVLFWGVDHKDAYKQCVGSPAWAHVLVLTTPHGAELYYRRSLCFGASGAVHGYNRVADFDTFTARMLLCIAVLHYFDNFTGVETAASADSACAAFVEFQELLGGELKPSKRSIR